MTNTLSCAALAFDAIATEFDARFGPCLSVAAQRRAVRSALTATFPPSGRILEIGGGTGEDAAFLARQGFRVLLTDPSPVMVSLAQAKLASLRSRAEVCAAEEMEHFAARYLCSGEALFDGAFSNFAPLNCVADLAPVARGLAQMLKPGAAAMLVLFGTVCPGEAVTELIRGRTRLALRRFKTSPVSARISGRHFFVTYHRCRGLRSAFAPWFVLEKRLGIGITVPPSAAEPWISTHPRFLGAMEWLDRAIRHPLAIFGDHVLYQFRRTGTACDAPRNQTME
jgi:SAM-dependent methyltransferase